MFSSDKLLHLVFASEQDTYYCNELLRLDLHKYLWLKLHERGYGCVYLLETGNGSLQVKTFGDSLAEPFAAKKGKWHFPKLSGKKSELQLWLTRQLTAKDPKRAAVICSMREFCEFFRGVSWQPMLQELSGLEKRTGILILTTSPEAESSAGCLLNDPVFEGLGERAILDLRGAAPCDMYAAMHRSMGGRMLFLNAFTAERIHAIVTRLLLEDPVRTRDANLQPELEGYLLQWMNNDAFRRREQEKGMRLPSPEESFRSVYAALQDSVQWNRLRGAAEQAVKAGGIEAYAASLDCPCVEDPVGAMRLRRAANSCANRCVHLDLGELLKAKSPDREGIVSLLEEIRGLALTVQNREENPHLIAAANRFLSEIPSSVHSRDPGTVRRLLFSIRFCFQWMYIQSNSEEETHILSILESLRKYVSCSRQYHALQRNYNMAASYRESRGKTMAMTLDQQRKKMEGVKRLLDWNEDLVQARVFNFSPASSADDISHLARDLAQELEEMRQAQELSLQESDTQPETPAEEPAGDESWMEEEYELTEADEVFNPFMRN